MGDFVLHDRDNLAIIYELVHVGGTTHEQRAVEAAASEIRCLRTKYEGILTSLARGVSPENLGFEGRRVAQTWGCPRTIFSEWTGVALRSPLPRFTAHRLPYPFGSVRGRFPGRLSLFYPLQQVFFLTACHQQDHQ